MDKLAEMLRQGADKLVNFPTEAQRFITNPQAFTQLLTGKNPLPRETGFAAGATGLPAQQGTILNPEYQAYMQGYEQGEPVSIAAMATPAAIPLAKALAPKAGQMAENYMVNQGFMPSIVAYHGTPHTIQGKFDISKVGTGEGAQAYGHGMYFAENPAVATQYKNILSKPEFTKTAEGVELRGQLPRMLDESYSELIAKNGIQQTNYGDVTDLVGQRLDRQMKDALKAKDMDWYNKVADMKLDLARFKENPPPNVGNLYKVDIPDADIPNMLNWDEKVPEDLRKRISAATMEQFGNGATGTSGEHLYKEIVFEMRRNGSKSPEADASKWLSEHGVTGIRYKDAMSRGADEGTSNFVLFDPAQVKIVEQNSKPMTRKEIIEEQIEKVAK